MALAGTYTWVEPLAVMVAPRARFTPGTAPPPPDGLVGRAEPFPEPEFVGFFGCCVGLVGLGDCLAGDEGGADCAMTGFEEPDEPVLTGDQPGALGEPAP